MLDANAKMPDLTQCLQRDPDMFFSYVHWVSRVRRSLVFFSHPIFYEIHWTDDRRSSLVQSGEYSVPYQAPIATYRRRRWHVHSFGSLSGDAAHSSKRHRFRWSADHVHRNIFGYTARGAEPKSARKACRPLVHRVLKFNPYSARRLTPEQVLPRPTHSSRSSYL